jgi:carbonic anhydrase/acetyltransferase-like protein (isoleucine patch superfamily)
MFKGPVISSSVFLAAGAKVVGRCTIGPHSSVWFNAVLRGDENYIEVGERTSIQDNATVHTDPGHPCVIGSGVTIGHNAVIACPSIT